MYLLQEEISPAIPYPVSPDAALEFSNKVLDRFRNPHIKHQWLSISMNYTAKLEMRVVPVLKRYYEIFRQVPDSIAFGFAAYILFIRPSVVDNGKYYGSKDGVNYLISDDKASLFCTHWENSDIRAIVTALLSDASLWNTNLTKLNGFADAVTGHLQEIMEKGVRQAISKLEMKKTIL